ncbi:type II secretion system protein [Shewanella sp. BF02_Schw]|uniref:type II secretion system protein n=1 Tax=Shewanella sp. BF02_Schw TaxID=394908 RepID=UPI00177FDF2B|nr:type II secretion system protein [Shewanella sp. BF02_Schw]MBO1897643.1 type II secretion system protein [Shewanella sp. BF02_Schw]
MFKSKFGIVQKGFTLIELVVTLSILGILMAVAATAYNDTSLAESNRLQSDVDKISKQAVKYASGGVFTGISMALLCADEYLNSDVCGTAGDGTGANPWAGNYTISVATTSPNRFSVKATAVPTNVGTSVAKYYKKTARSVQYTPGSKLFELIFGT